MIDEAADFMPKAICAQNQKNKTPQRRDAEAQRSAEKFSDLASTFFVFISVAVLQR